MSDRKIKMKIGRYEKHIGKHDLILDNGACIQVVTQRGAWGMWDYAPLTMSKKLFKDLKKLCLIFVDEEKTKKANERYKKPCLTYYRFDIDRMIESGYEVVEK
jgi:hypothetical protein